MKKKWSPNKYELYEKSVQDSANDAAILDDIYRMARKKKPKDLREDFCGTFSVACEWVKRGKQNKSWALDIDPEPLDYGKKTHLSRLKPEQQQRVHVLKKNVISKTPPVDLVAACNFSYWIFKERKVLLSYFKKVYASLKRDGLFFLDVVGGTEMAQLHKDKVKYGRGKKKYTYIWEHEKFNPLTHEGFFSISFNLSNGQKMKQAFTYDWRIWNIPELKDVLLDAGFKNTWVYWEKEDKRGNATGKFYRTEKEDNSECWIAYLVASKI